MSSIAAEQAINLQAKGHLPHRMASIRKIYAILCSISTCAKASAQNQMISENIFYFFYFYRACSGTDQF